MYDYCLKHLIEMITAMLMGLAVIIRSLRISSGLRTIDSEIRENRKALQDLKEEIRTLSLKMELKRINENKYNK